jgi:hypothetical protein
VADLARVRRAGPGRAGTVPRAPVDFDLGFAYEALARAHAVAGDRADADRYAAEGLRHAEAVADREDRELLLSDLATLP